VLIASWSSPFVSRVITRQGHPHALRRAAIIDGETVGIASMLRNETRAGDAPPDARPGSVAGTHPCDTIVERMGRGGDLIGLAGPRTAMARIGGNRAIVRAGTHRPDRYRHT
jgi:hypothetical protein